MIRDNILGLRNRISSVCKKTSRNPDEITIIAVSKGRNAEQIKEVTEAGIKDIGENKVQEAFLKYKQLSDLTKSKEIRWHMIGYLQTNKVKDAVKIFDMIQSVDSIRLAAEINKHAAKINKIQDVLLEINVSGEMSKFGFKPSEAVNVAGEISKFKNINLKGLMCIAPLVKNPEETRQYFRMLRELMEKINISTNQQLTILSMGMTDDFEIAIEEGSNMIRLGRAIFM